MSAIDPASLRKSLRTVARAYLDQVSAMSYDDLRARQRPPWASVAFGAGGIAAALARPARRGARRNPEALARAMRWLADASRRTDERGAFRGEDLAFDDVDPDLSLAFGGGGLELVRILADGAAPSAKARRALLARCKRAHGGSSELLFGAAGLLSGLVIVAKQTRDPAIQKAAASIAGDLLARAHGENAWTRDPHLAFAHGRAGTFHALLGWASAAKSELPAWIWDELDRLAADVDARGTMGAPPAPVNGRSLARTWCNGAAGLVLLWARAYEHTGDRRFLRRARAAANTLRADAAGWSGDLCCGLGGRAYALLAMDRIAPNGGWDARALAMTSRAVDAMIAEPGPWPNGLLHGFPGLVCLIDDLDRPASKRMGFPLVEG